MQRRAHPFVAVASGFDFRIVGQERAIADWDTTGPSITRDGVGIASGESETGTSVRRYPSQRDEKAGCYGTECVDRRPLPVQPSDQLRGVH